MTSVSATLRKAPVSERKARLVAGLIRGLSVQEAEIQLRASQKKTSDLLLTLLRSAVANAEHNKNLDPSTLRVSSVLVDGAGMFKRYQPRAFGRAYPIRRRQSHITLTVSGEPAKVSSRATKSASSTSSKKKVSSSKKATSKKSDTSASVKKKVTKKKSSAKKATSTTAKKTKN